MGRVVEATLLVIGKDLEKKLMVSCEEGSDSFLVFWLPEVAKSLVVVAEGLFELKDHLYYTYKISGG